VRSGSSLGAPAARRSKVRYAPSKPRCLGLEVPRDQEGYAATRRGLPSSVGAAWGSRRPTRCPTHVLPDLLPVPAPGPGLRSYPSEGSQIEIYPLLSFSGLQRQPDSGRGDVCSGRARWKRPCKAAPGPGERRRCLSIIESSRRGWITSPPQLDTRPWLKRRAAALYEQPWPPPLHKTPSRRHELGQDA
jgi:hypothetical protein